MLTAGPMVKIILCVSFASAIVSPGQLYRMVDHVVGVYMNDSCLVVMSSGGYTPASYVPVVYVDPYHQEIRVKNASLTPEENYKMFIIAPVLELGCSGFLIQVENPGNQLRLIEKTFVHVNQRTRRGFIFVPTTARFATGSMGTQDEVLDSENFEFRSVLQEKSVRYIPDVIFAVPNDEDNRVAVLTHRFGGPGEAYRQEMLLDIYDVARERFELGRNLFPDKIKDLDGRVLKIAIFNYPPAIVIDNGNGKKNCSTCTWVDGSEWRFVQEFANLHNSSLEVIVHDEGSWGEIHKNLTGTGITGTLLADKVDLAMSSLFTRYSRFLYLDQSFPHHRSGITCIVPGPRQFPQWMSPILPFQPTLWATFIGVTILSAISTELVNRAESLVRFKDSFQMSFSEAALTVSGITLLQGLRKHPKGTSWAVLAMSLLVVSLLLATAYGSSLASAITVPKYERPIDTARELAASGIPWGSVNQAWIHPILDAEGPVIRTLVKNFRELSPEELTRHSADGRTWAFVIERFRGRYLIPDHLSEESLRKMHLMKDDIYWSHCVSILRKSSPFTDWYTKRVLELHSSGIPAYWLTDIVLQHLDISTQLAIENDNLEDSGPERIKVRQLQGIFYLLIIGLVLSGLAFLKELYTHLLDGKGAGQDAARD